MIIEILVALNSALVIIALLLLLRKQHNVFTIRAELQLFYSLLNTMHMKHAELIQALTDLKDQADRSKAEIVAKITALEEALANAENLPAEVTAAVDALKQSVQAVDDVA